MSRVMKPIQHYRDRQKVKLAITELSEKYQFTSKHRLMLQFALYRSSTEYEKATFNALKDQPEEEE